MPLKRHEYLKAFSRDHHHSLLLCWKIRTGIIKEVDAARIYSYCQAFYSHSLKSHFDLEEQYIFPLLGPEHHLVKKALAQHEELRQMFLNGYPDKKSLLQLEAALEKHIRFEERKLFATIQEKEGKSLEELNALESFPESMPWEDEFWK